MFTTFTIQQGQRIAIWDAMGKRELVDGPRRIGVWRRRVEVLQQAVAGPDQFLIVKLKDGRVQHIPGPSSMWIDPVEHAAVKVAQVITLDANQAVAIYRQQADEIDRRIVAGPARIVPTPQERIEQLTVAVAGPEEYLVVKYTDGRVQHIAGPTSLWLDPAQHLAIKPAPMMTLDANEAVVVYRNHNGQIDRRVLRGPACYVPTAEEWLHEFRWHGADPANPKRKIPRGLVFKKLRVIPDQLYFDVEDVRTADDALLTIKLMVFFELMEIDVMLDQTHDPIADFINAVTADVIDFAAGRTFEMFKDQTEKMNDLGTYKQLAQRSGRIGYRINKVVYRGYQATAKLQTMHDGAIEARTKLKLDAETETQSQDLADLKLTRERERTQQRQTMVQEEAEHQRLLNRLEHEEQLQQQAAKAAAALAAGENRKAAAIRHADARYSQRIAYLKAIEGLQVDMTRYMVARYEKPDKRIRVDGIASRLQLHETTG